MGKSKSVGFEGPPAHNSHRTSIGEGNKEDDVEATIINNKMRDKPYGNQHYQCTMN